MNNKVGGYRYVVLNKVKDCYKFSQASKSNPSAVGLFLAGGKAIDEKVVLANKQIVANEKQKNSKNNGIVKFLKKYLNWGRM